MLPMRRVWALRTMGSCRNQAMPGPQQPEHVSNMMAKLGVTNRGEAAALARHLVG
jgi:hypothetical protein